MVIDPTKSTLIGGDHGLNYRICTPKDSDEHNLDSNMFKNVGKMEFFVKDWTNGYVGRRKFRWVMNLMRLEK